MLRHYKALPIEVQRKRPPRIIRFKLSGRSNGDVDIRVYGFQDEELSGSPVLYNRYEIVGGAEMVIEVPVKLREEP